LGHLIITLSNELLQTLQPRPLQPDYALTRAAPDPQTRYQLTLRDEIDDLQTTVTIRETKTNPEQVIVSVEVDIPSRGGWPDLAEIDVTLKLDERIIAQQSTDAFGKAVFPNLNANILPQLTIEIAPD